MTKISYHSFRFTLKVIGIHNIKLHTTQHSSTLQVNVLVHKPPPTVPFNYASVVKKKRKAANLIKDELQKEEVAYRSRRFGPAIEVTLKESGTKLRIKQNVEIQKVHVAITHVNEKHLQSGNGQEKEVSRSKPVAYANPRGAALHLLYKLDLIEKHGNM